MIGWPASLLGDMMQGRKKLTLTRAVEFSQFSKMNSFQCERLIIWSLKDSDHPQVQDYAEKYLQSEGKAIAFPDAKIPMSLYEGDFLSVILYHYLDWTRGKVPVTEISALLPVFSDYADEASLNQRLDFLCEEGFILREENRISVTEKPIHSVAGNNGPKLVTDIFNVMLEKHRDMVKWQTVSMVFPQAKVPEFVQRLVALRNWIVSTSDSHAPTADSPLNEHVMMLQNLTFAFLSEMDPSIDYMPKTDVK
jgi:hypothetical protein